MKTAEENQMKKITPFLWFDSEAEQAAKFYVGIFKNSKIGKITRYSEDGPRPKGSVMTVEFTLDRVEFVALNPESVRGSSSSPKQSRSRSTARTRMKSIISGRNFPPTVDRPRKLSGWLKDKFGLSWQVNPVFLDDMLGDPDAGKANRVMKAMMQMDKIDIAALEKAARG